MYISVQSVQLHFWRIALCCVSYTQCSNSSTDTTMRRLRQQHGVTLPVELSHKRQERSCTNRYRTPWFYGKFKPPKVKRVICTHSKEKRLRYTISFSLPHEKYSLSAKIAQLHFLLMQFNRSREITSCTSIKIQTKLNEKNRYLPYGSLRWILHTDSTRGAHLPHACEIAFFFF